MHGEIRGAAHIQLHLETLLRLPLPDATRLKTSDGPVRIGDGNGLYLCGACDTALISGVGPGRHITARAAEVVARCFECEADNIVPFVFG